MRMCSFLRGFGVVLALGVLATGTSVAQEARGWLRILPVGDAPPFIQKIVNGVRVQQSAPRGSRCRITGFRDQRFT